MPDVTAFDDAAAVTFRMKRRRVASKRNSIFNVPLANAMTEDELLTCVLDAARALGWRTAHFRPAKTERGWRTAVQGDGKGFADLVCVNPRMGEVIYVECKSERGKLTPEQEQWRQALTDVGQRFYVWRPSCWLSGEVMSVLEGAE